MRGGGGVRSATTRGRAACVAAAVVVVGAAPRGVVVALARRAVASRAAPELGDGSEVRAAGPLLHAKRAHASAAIQYRVPVTPHCLPPVGRQW
jgi:hypothetical protein